MLTIRSVPESITRQQLCDWLAAIGVTAEDVPRETTIVLSRSSITVEVFVQDNDGNRLVVDGEAARHRIVIPILPADMWA